MNDKKMLNVKLDEEVMKKLKVYCALTDKTITQVIEELIETLELPWVKLP